MTNEIDLTQFEGHTAGPWYYDPSDRTICFEDDGDPLAICTIDPVDIPIGTRWQFGRSTGANINLISAAPVLLAEVIRQRQEIAALKADAERYRLALVEISAIEDEMYGGDWDEIELARKIANTAMNTGA